MQHELWGERGMNISFRSGYSVPMCVYLYIRGIFNAVKWIEEEEVEKKRIDIIKVVENFIHKIRRKKWRTSAHMDVRKQAHTSALAHSISLARCPALPLFLILSLSPATTGTPHRVCLPVRIGKLLNTMRSMNECGYNVWNCVSNAIRCPCPLWTCATQMCPILHCSYFLFFPHWRRRRHHNQRGCCCYCCCCARHSLMCCCLLTLFEIFIRNGPHSLEFIFSHNTIELSHLSHHNNNNSNE